MKIITRQGTEIEIKKNSIRIGQQVIKGSIFYADPGAVNTQTLNNLSDQPAIGKVLVVFEKQGQEPLYVSAPIKSVLN